MRIPIILLKVAIGILLLYFVFSKIDGQNVLKLLLEADLMYFLLACVVLAAGITINAQRWRYVMDGLGVPMRWKTALTGSFEGTFFNQLLPTGSGGDAARMVRVHDSGTRISWSVIGVVLDRVYGLWFVCLFIVLAAIFASSRVVTPPIFRILTITAALIVLGGIIAVYVGAVLRDGWLPKWAQHFVTLANSYSRVVCSPNAILGICGTLVASNIMIIISFMMTTKAIGVNIDWINALIIVQGIALASVIPVSIGGWGIREGAAILLFSGIDIGSSEATAVAVLFGLVLTVMALIGAIVWMSSGYKRVGFSFGSKNTGRHGKLSRERADKKKDTP